ncbi:hypothetical protein ACVWZW_002706 [Bradyrhizobium sp. F1.13.4]
MLGSKAAGGGDAFDIGQQYASRSQREELVGLQQTKTRQPDSRQSLWDLPGDWYAKRRKAKQCCQDNRQRHDREPDRPSRQPPLSHQQERERDGSDRQNQPIDAAELAGELDGAIEEIVTASGDTEQARQLAHHDGKSRAGLEADQDTVAHQADENAELEQPRDQTEQRHRACGQACDLGVFRRISGGQRPDRRRNHQRDRGGRTDRKLARRPEQRIAEAAEHVAVDADLRRQARQSRVGQRHGDGVSREGDSGDCVRTQPGTVILRQPDCGRKQEGPARSAVR